MSFCIVHLIDSTGLGGAQSMLCELYLAIQEYYPKYTQLVISNERMATDKNFKKLDGIKKEKAKVVKREEQKFIELKEKIDQISLTITAEAKENEELYGSISQNQILKLLSTEGVELDKDSLVLDEPINKLGVYNLVVNLYTSVKASLRVWVVKK